MAVFQNLSEKINHVFSKLSNRGALTEMEIKQAMREVRVALLEADVNFTVAKDFISKVTELAMGEKILKSFITFLLFRMPFGGDELSPWQRVG